MGTSVIRIAKPHKGSINAFLPQSSPSIKLPRIDRGDLGAYESRRLQRLADDLGIPAMPWRLTDQIPIHRNYPDRPVAVSVTADSVNEPLRRSHPLAKVVQHGYCKGTHCVMGPVRAYTYPKAQLFAGRVPASTIEVRTTKAKK